MVLDRSRFNRDDAAMSVSEEIRSRLSRWCADRVPDAERDHRQVGYTISGAEVIIHDRRAPAYPELDAAWPSVALARLRHDDPEPGRWALYRPVGSDGWRRAADGDDPLALLDLVTP
jgi:hypothetical protein